MSKKGRETTDSWTTLDGSLSQKEPSTWCVFELLNFKGNGSHLFPENFKWWNVRGRKRVTFYLLIETEELDFECKSRSLVCKITSLTYCSHDRWPLRTKSPIGFSGQLRSSSCFCSLSLHKKLSSSHYNHISKRGGTIRVTERCFDQTHVSRPVDNTDPYVTYTDSYLL